MVGHLAPLDTWYLSRASMSPRQTTRRGGRSTVGHRRTGNATHGNKTRAALLVDGTDVVGCILTFYIDNTDIGLHQRLTRFTVNSVGLTHTTPGQPSHTTKHSMNAEEDTGQHMIPDSSPNIARHGDRRGGVLDHATRTQRHARLTTSLVHHPDRPPLRMQNRRRRVLVFARQYS